MEIERTSCGAVSRIMRREHQGVILLRASRTVRRQNKSRERIDDPRQEDLMVPLLQGVELIRGGLSDGLTFSSERLAFPLCLQARNFSSKEEEEDEAKGLMEEMRKTW